MTDMDGAIGPRMHRVRAAGSAARRERSGGQTLGGLGVLAFLLGAALGCAPAFADDAGTALSDRLRRALIAEGADAAVVRRAAPKFVYESRGAAMAGRVEWTGPDGGLRSTGEAEAIVLDQPDPVAARRAAIDVLLSGLAPIAANEISR